MHPPPHNHLLRQLLPAVLEAGACQLQIRAEGFDAQSKSDGSPVTRADRETEAILTAALGRIAPGVPIIGEEAVNAGSIPAFDDIAFLVDALDGTKEFVRGGDDFTVNVALVRNHVPVFGIVFAPAMGRLFATAGEGQAVQGRIEPARLAGNAQVALKPISTSEPEARGLRVVSSRSARSQATEALLARFAIATDVRMGSSVKFGLIASGEADLYPRLGPTNAWDIAAGHAVLSAAGGTVTNTRGEPLTYLDASRLHAPEPFLNPSFVAWGRPSLVRPVE